MQRTLITILALLVLTACGGESMAPAPDVNGSWSYTVENLTGPVLQGGSCSFTGITLNLTQSDQSFSGSHTSGTETCTVNSQTHTLVIDAGSISDGTLNDGQVTFTLGAVHNSGSLTTSTMAGAVTGTATVDGTTGPISGIWTAVRQ